MNILQAGSLHSFYNMFSLFKLSLYNSSLSSGMALVNLLVSSSRNPPASTTDDLDCMWREPYQVSDENICVPLCLHAALA